MDQYGVGCLVVCEVLQVMECFGFVEIVYGEWVCVVDFMVDCLIVQIVVGVQYFLCIKLDMFRYMKEVCVFLEISIVCMVVECVIEEQVVCLCEVIVVYCVLMVNLEEFIECDMVFYCEIVDISGNFIFFLVVELMFCWVSEFYIILVCVFGVEELILVEYQCIVDVIVVYDGDVVVDVMCVYLMWVNDLYWELGQQ